MTPEHITALAAACERAAQYADYVSEERIVDLYHSPLGEGSLSSAETARQSARRDVETFRAHARALRDGRVTITEETTDG